jgi:rhamnulokinase
MSATYYAACDLGAESGRVMLGALADGKLTLEEIHRFPTGGVNIAGSLRWDVLRIWDEIKTGLRKVAARGVKIESVSADSWGVDYVWLRGDEPLLTLPCHYRDGRTDGAFERAFAVATREEIFAESGIQFMQFNTLYQLHADAEQRRWLFKTADRFLFIADYFNWLMSGVGKAEVSLASTSQLYNPKRKKWSRALLKKLGLPKRLFPEIVPSGTVLGPVLPELGLGDAKVVASCSHDTGAAVAAVPGKGKDWAYLSSGTWSLLGVETKKPVINEQALALNFTNEVGFGHSIRFLRNIVGLWIAQECRRTWAADGRDYTYDQLVKLAGEAEPLRSLIQPNDARFVKAGDMPSKVAGYCRQTGQPEPVTHGQIARCVLESLALLYAQQIKEIEVLTGREIKRLHIVGGGSQNALLNQFSANATGLPVLAGPVEATAVGNILVQAIALGHLADLAGLRKVVGNSFPVTEFSPQDAGVWSQARRRFEALR